MSCGPGPAISVSRPSSSVVYHRSSKGKEEDDDEDEMIDSEDDHMDVDIKDGKDENSQQIWVQGLDDFGPG